tara:strand:+ start:51 stop:497 length:447 start_codon:yes stop_codon:yes gene_type:complete
MNKDSQKIWESYNLQVNDAPPGPAPAKPRGVDEILQDVEAAFANGIGQDRDTVDNQVQTLNSASASLMDMHNNHQTKAGSQIDTAGRLGRARMVDDEYPAQVEIDELKRAYQRVSDITNAIEPIAQRLGVRLESLQESLQQLGQLLSE